ncbi:MAG: hypothetical protein WCD44_00320, partial [Candidatus Babeliales bacterium]
PDIHSDALHPEHIFRIAQQGTIGALATHLGLISRYAKQYNEINYIVKLNAKTNIISTEQHDPVSRTLWNIKQVITIKKNYSLNICGIGFTLYLGSEFESLMLEQAAQNIYEAHQHGLITVLWIYPRGKTITNEQDNNLLAGAAGIANSLGADFVKIKPPHGTKILSSAQLLKIIIATAGNTKVICAGGETKEPKIFLEKLYDQIHISGTAGCATGRNIFQHSLPQAIAMTKAISSIVDNDIDIKTILKDFEEKV